MVPAPGSTPRPTLGAITSSDRDQISALLCLYAERIDAGDFEGLADLLGHAELTAEGSDHVTRGADAVRALYDATTLRYEDGTPRTKHLTTNVIVEIDDGGASASARSYFTVLQAVPGRLALQPVVAGRYRDRFERAEDGWRFSGRHIVVDLVGDVSQHLRIEIP
ncbi:MAG TPA: nuclear transport factor 2 family protein [Acidimicrobiales bacterium]|nr:nuclear transport factor 2 family protein [Acidimicrobiales bacterium]